MKTKLKVGNQVSVANRFGETGKIVEIRPDQPNPYGVEFSGMEFPLFYKEHELQKLGRFERAFSWFRMPE